jgi:hypothetical protein
VSEPQTTFLIAKPVNLPKPMDFDAVIWRVVRAKPEHQQPKPKMANGWSRL